MGFYASADELQRELVAFLRRFMGSEDGARAIETARTLSDHACLALRTSGPDAVVSVDFLAGTVSLDPVAEPTVEIALEADDLHDILLDRLDPVQISRLYEMDALTFDGAPPALSALIVLAGPLAPHYARSLRERGRDDLLETPRPPSRLVWSGEGPPKRVINQRRPWQRPKRAVTASV